MRNIEQTASGLFDKLRNRFSPVKIRDEKRESTLDPEKARFFSFDYTANGKNFGSITISVLGKDLKVFYAQDIDQLMSPIEKKQWFKFLKELRFFAMAEGAVFDVRDIGKSGLNLRDLKYLNKDSEVYSKDEVNVNESKLYGTRRSSYQQLEDVRIIARHSKPIVDETIPGVRSRNVESFYIENSQGERFKLPQGTTINGARAYARHVKNGGQLHDDFGQHIGRMIKEMADLRMFVRNMRGRTFEDIETQQMVESAIDHYGRLHSDLHLIRSQRGYDQYRELWQPEVLEEAEFDLTELRERFVRKVFDDRITSALPVVFREYRRRKMATEQEFESWANDIVREFEENPVDKENKKKAMDGVDIEEDSSDINVKSPFANSLRNAERDSAENIVDDNENQNLAGLLNEKGFEFRFQDGVYYFESKEEIERAKDWISLKFPKMKFPKMGVYDYGYGVYGSTTFDRELPGGKGVMESQRQQELTENLRKWFKEKWVRFGPDGKIRGDCARGDSSEGKPKCLPQSKAHALGKKGRASAASRKRREDPNPERSGAAINVKTKKESINEVSRETLAKYIKANVQDQLDRATSDSFKSGRAGDWYNKAPFDTPVDRKRERGLDRAIKRLSKGVKEGQHDSAADEYRAHLIKTMPQLMKFLERSIEGWRPSEEQMMAAIETAYTVMKHTGDIKQAGQAMMDELNTLHRMSQGQQGVTENYYSDLMKKTYAKFFKPAPSKTVSAVKKFLSNMIITLGTAQDTDYDEQEPKEINWKQDLSDVREAYGKLRSNSSPNWFDLADAVFSYDTEFRESMLEWAEEQLGSKLVDILWHEVWQAKQQISRADGSHDVDVDSGQKVPPQKSYDPEKYRPDSPRNIEWKVVINGEPKIKFGGVSNNKEAAIKTGLSWARNHGYEREVQAGKVEVVQVQQGVAEGQLNEFNPTKFVGNFNRGGGAGRGGDGDDDRNERDDSDDEGIINKILQALERLQPDPFETYGGEVEDVVVNLVSGGRLDDYIRAVGMGNIPMKELIKQGVIQTLKELKELYGNQGVAEGQVNELAPNPGGGDGGGRDDGDDGFELPLDFKGQNILVWPRNKKHSMGDTATPFPRGERFTGKVYIMWDGPKIEAIFYLDPKDREDREAEYERVYGPQGRGYEDWLDHKWYDTTGVRYRFVTDWRLIPAKEPGGWPGIVDAIGQDMKAEVMNYPESFITEIIQKDGDGRHFVEPRQSVAEGSLNEFAPGDGSGEGRWYTDDQMIDIVGPDWAPEDDAGHLTLGQRLQDAQAWLDDQGYSVVVEDVEIDLEGGYRWKIYGEFYNPRFAKKDQGVAEGQVNEFAPNPKDDNDDDGEKPNNHYVVFEFNDQGNILEPAYMFDNKNDALGYLEEGGYAIGAAVIQYVYGFPKKLVKQQWETNNITVKQLRTNKNFLNLIKTYKGPFKHEGGYYESQQGVSEGRTMCPECGGPAYSNSMLAEKQDACYHKVRSRYKVWPSAYASGALVQCRKKGAKNWGNKSK